MPVVLKSGFSFDRMTSANLEHTVKPRKDHSFYHPHNASAGPSTGPSQEDGIHIRGPVQIPCVSLGDEHPGPFAKPSLALA